MSEVKTAGGYDGVAQVDSLGGFSVPPELAKQVEKWLKNPVAFTTTFIEGGQIMNKQWINSDENTKVNSELVTSWSWETVEMSKELSRAGITRVTLFLDAADDTQHIVSDLDELVVWAKFILEDHKLPVVGTFEHYVSNAKRYRDQCEEEAKL
jgi:hypothetical protein